MRLLSSIYKRKVSVCVIIIIALAAGIFFTTQMSISLLPDITLPYLGVSIIYPGASATSVEDDVSVPVEAELRKISNVHSITVTSIDNASIAIIHYDYGIDLDEKKDELKERLNNLVLPDTCYEPSIVEVDFNGWAVATVSVYDSDGDIFKALADAEVLQEKFFAIEGVGSVSLIGAPENKVAITPINGLEMTTLLFAQALSLDALDIPIGEIVTEDGAILVRNLSSATTVEELAQKPISITLPTTTWESLSSVKEALVWYAESTSTELDDMKTDIDGILEFIDELEDMDNDELDEINDNLSLFSSLITLVRENTSGSLKIMWSQIISDLVTDETFLALSDDEIDDMANQLGMSPTLLRWVRDNSVVEDGETKSNVEKYWDKMVEFRVQQETAGNVDDNEVLTIDNHEYSDMFYYMGVVQKDDENADDYYSQEDLNDAVDLAIAINTIGLDSVVTTLKEENDGVLDDDGELVYVTDEQYALMFANTEFDENLPMSGTTISIIRGEHFEENWSTIYNYKLAHQHTATQEEIDALELEDGETPPTYTADELTSQDLFSIYEDLVLDDELPITLTLDLTEFIWTTDFDELIYESDNTSTLNTEIGKIAKVERKVVYDSTAYINDFTSLTLEVYTVSGANQTQVSQQVKEVLAEQGELLESNILLLDDQSEFINDSISNVLMSMIIGGVLAILVILLFIRDFRTSIIIGITMPLSVLCALMCLYFMGISLNMVSLGGLAVGIGMLVDNSIVVIESIALERDKGKSAYDAAVSGTQIVLSPLIASTLTSICVFFPILFTSGLTREIFTDLSWAVIFSLSFSLLVAVTIIPTLYCLVFSKSQILGGKALGNTDRAPKKEKLPKKEAKAHKQNGKPRGLSVWVSALLDKILPKLLKKRWLTLIVAIVVFGASVLLVFTTGTEFLPPSDKGIIEVSIAFSPTQDIYECQAQTLVAKNEIAAEIDNIEYISTQCSKATIISTSISGIITVHLDDKAGKTSEVVEDIRELLDDNGYNSVSITEIDGIVTTLTSGMMSGLAVEVVGEDTEVLREIAADVETELNKLGYVRHVENDLTELSTEYVLNIDQKKCLDNSIDYTILIETLYVGVSGLSPSDISIDGETMEIEVIFSDNALSEYYDGIENFVVGFNDDGDAIKLQDIADIQISQQSSTITRSGGLYIATISVETYGIDTGTASDEILEAVNSVLSQEKYSGYTADESGVNYYLSDAFSGLVVALIVSFFLLFGVMACQFESLTKPFVVIFSIPFAFTGGFLALAITGTELSVVSFVGLIMLMGVVVNDAILLIERVVGFINEGMDKSLAVVEGTKSRVRPILMTTLTTVVALLPLALGLGKGSDLMQPLGIVVIGGLSLGTIVVLIFIPIMFALINRIKPQKVSQTVEETTENSEVSVQDENVQTETTEETHNQDDSDKEQ